MSLNPQALGNGQEQYEYYRSTAAKGSSQPAPLRCQYDYRHTDGELFSCVAISLLDAQAKRNAWIADRA